MSLETDIEDIRTGIRAGAYGSEAAISQGIVLRLLQALGWPTYDTQVVSPEYSLEGRRVDYALCHPRARPTAFIEVKQIGQSEGADRQLFEYAFIAGVPLAILTDGQEWNFFLPGEQGDYGERRVYKLDIIERDVAECTSRLNRYLRYDAIVSGTARTNAREDYQSVARQRLMNEALPKAWRKLIDEEDEILLDLLAETVEDICGFKPSPDMVAGFLKNYLGHTFANSRPVISVQQPNPPVVRVVPAVLEGNNGGITYAIDGKTYPARSGREVLVNVLELLSQRDPTFSERFASLPKHGRTRRYFSRAAIDLYPGRPDLARDYSVQLSTGWWVGTNHSSQSIERILRMACGVANMRYGKDLVVNL